MNDALTSYRQLEIVSSSPEVLVLRLYEAALRHCRTGREHAEAGRVRERNEAATKALAIVGELQQVLDFERGGEIARELDRLYAFASERLVAACVTGGAPALGDALRVLEPLHEGWAGVVATPREDVAPVRREDGA